MHIAIGSDHRGFRLKERIVSLLLGAGHELDDEGTGSSESCDYPDFGARVARKVSQGLADRGILVCGTGIGMAIVANKFRGVRAAPCYDELSAELSRRHNDLNVLCLAANMTGERLIDQLVLTWLRTDFEAGRHARRVDKIGRLECDQSGCQDRSVTPAEPG